ncbi:MAG: hypothetical protein V3U62_08940, partial [Sedimenticolaceae bacterium]
VSPMVVLMSRNNKSTRYPAFFQFLSNNTFSYNSKIAPHSVFKELIDKLAVNAVLYAHILNGFSVRDRSMFIFKLVGPWKSGFFVYR